MAASRPSRTIRRILPNTTGCRLLYVGEDWVQDHPILGWTVEWIIDETRGDIVLSTPITTEEHGLCDHPYVIVHPNGSCENIDQVFDSVNDAITTIRQRWQPKVP
jgi:hypothetical protein